VSASHRIRNDSAPRPHANSATDSLQKSEPMTGSGERAAEHLPRYGLVRKD
jgi:hypothetical protein